MTHSLSDTSQKLAQSARRTALFGFFCVTLLVVGLGGWAATARIDGAVVASGKVEVEQNRQVVAHTDGGEVASVNVREGSVVNTGDLLLSLSGERIGNQITIARNEFHELLARSLRLTAERDGQNKITFTEELRDAAQTDPQVAHMINGQINLFEARKLTAITEVEQLGRKHSQIRSQIDGLEAQKIATVQQLELINEELTAQETLLKRGLTQQSRVISLRREIVSLSGELGRLEAAQAEAEVQITELEIATLKTGTDRRESAIEQLRDIQVNISRLREELNGYLAHQTRLDVRAPVSGVVYDLSVFGTGAVISPAQPILYIVPQNRPLIIATRIPPIHVDQVYPGQPVRLRFTTFDQRTTPELTGSVQRISADAFIDEATGQNFYRVAIQIPEDQRAKLPNGSVLIPGMPVEAYMSTGERTVLAYLTKPLMDYFTRAFRED